MTDLIRTRFAPSPTGAFHIGGARTALFNWLYARSKGGVFVLRIEDTDATRSTPESLRQLLDGLSWLGLGWDEGPTVDGKAEKGDFGPYFQSKRGEIYQRYIERLLSEGKAYEDEGAVRFKMPKTPCTVHDLICGDIHFDRKNDPDLVIRRANGTPVFHLVNVVDDLEMGITHVIRGEDHLSNTPKHLALFEALGVRPPHYAHIPLILNPGGSKMSKRDEGASVEEYIRQGYLPSAVRNYLCLLGWSPKDHREVISIEEVMKIFDLSQINRANARFDLNKMYWLNGEHWKALSEEEFMTFSLNFLKSQGVLKGHEDDQLVRGALSIIREKIKVGRDLPDWIAPFLETELTYESEAVQKRFRDPGAIERLRTMRDAFANLAAFTASDVERALKAVVEKMGGKIGDFVHPMRLAVSGRAVGPSLYHMIEVLGRERVLARIDATLEKLADGRLFT